MDVVGRPTQEAKSEGEGVRNSRRTSPHPNPLPVGEAVAKGYSTKSSFSLREKVRMRERRKPLNCISHSLTLQSLTPALSRREREFIGFCDTL